MSISQGNAPEASKKRRTYCRKQKSLGLLCTNFLSLYNREDNDVIGLDDAAKKLGVERRRIYDIVNVLESVGVLARRAKNQYSWKGFQAIPKALKELKEEGLRENPSALDKDINSTAKDLDDADYNEEDDESDCNPNTGSQNDNSVAGTTARSVAGSRFDSRKEKSLGLLTRNFVKLFVCTNVDLISLDEAAKLLLGDGHSSSIMRTKVRRIYDIANVLSSLKLIEKTHTADSRKPAFRWFGIGGKPENKSADTFGLCNTTKRAFGADITNICFKRNKVDSPVNGEHRQILKKPGTCNLGNDRQQGSSSYQFGPFAPASFSKVCGSENEVTQTHDWESLASTYRLQYHNQALKDLFAHYMEAWQSWYTEVAGRKSVQQIS